MENMSINQTTLFRNGINNNKVSLPSFRDRVPPQQPDDVTAHDPVRLVLPCVQRDADGAVAAADLSHITRPPRLIIQPDLELAVHPQLSLCERRHPGRLRAHATLLDGVEVRAAGGVDDLDRRGLGGLNNLRIRKEFRALARTRSRSSSSGSLGCAS